MNYLDYGSSATDAATIVSEYGVSLHLGRDFSEFSRLHNEVRPGVGLTPIFDPEHTDIENCGFWLKGVVGGEVVQLQAMRYIDLGRQTLAEHLSARAAEYKPPYIDADPAKARFDLSPISAEIQGRVVYHGEYWLAKSLRGGGLTSVFPRYLLSLGQLVFDPDYVFGFQEWNLAFNGLGTKEGYDHVKIQGMRWHMNDGTESTRAIVWMGRKDIAQMINTNPAEVYQYIENMREARSNCSHSKLKPPMTTPII